MNNNTILKDSLVIADGPSLAITAFYGTATKEYLTAKTDAERDLAAKKLLQTSDGIYTNATFQFFKMLKSFEEKFNPSRLIVAWDINRNTFRKDFYPDYKANRKETRIELSSQLKQIQQILEYIGIPSISREGYEADDLIGSLAEKFKKDYNIIILSKDQDLIQLIDENVKVWLITTKYEEICECVEEMPPVSLPQTFPFTPEYVEKYYGFKPIQMIDYKALSGDASDNIPGIKGVGEKSSIALINEYGTLENIYKAFENISDEEIKKIKEAFKAKGVSRLPVKAILDDINGEKLGEKSKFLATIKRDMTDLPEIEALSYNPDNDKRIKIFSRLEFNSLL